MTTSRSDLPPFLDDEPPPWAMRSLSTVLLLLFACAVAAVFLVEIPETVSARFVLEPVRGTDPVRALYTGTISEVQVAEAQPIRNRDVLFVLTSEIVGDRMSERRTVDTRLSGGRERLTNERSKFTNQESADEQERRRLDQAIAALDRQVQIKTQQLTTLQEIAARRQRAFETGATSWNDANMAKLEVNQLSAELERMRAEIDDGKSTLARLTFEMAFRRAAFAETERGIQEEMTALKARKDVLDRDTSRSGNALSIAAPCDGAVVKLHVRQAGTVVGENDLLAEIVCAGEPLRAELRLPERGMALVRVGQPVKLLYDAFPYERYGVQYGTLTWLSPASSAAPQPQGAAFRAFANLTADTVSVQGGAQAVLPGMTGRAAVIVGRRSLASYAIEPVRRLRESMSTRPPDKVVDGRASAGSPH